MNGRIATIVPQLRASAQLSIPRLFDGRRAADLNTHLSLVAREQVTLSAPLPSTVSTQKTLTPLSMIVLLMSRASESDLDAAEGALLGRQTHERTHSARTIAVPTRDSPYTFRVKIRLGIPA